MHQHITLCPSLRSTARSLNQPPPPHRVKNCSLLELGRFFSCFFKPNRHYNGLKITPFLSCFFTLTSKLQNQSFQTFKAFSKHLTMHLTLVFHNTPNLRGKHFWEAFNLQIYSVFLQVFKMVDIGWSTSAAVKGSKWSSVTRVE